MKLQSHVIAGALGAAVAYPFIGSEKTTLFFVASFMIDADHYLEYLWRTKGADWSPKRMFRYYDRVTEHSKDKENLGFSLLHTVEMFLLIYLLGIFIHPIFVPILWGMAYHMVFDIVWLTYHKAPFVRAYSIVEYFIRKQKMIKEGNDPKNFYKKVFELSANK